MLLGYGEFLIDTVVALALIVGGTILLGVVMYDFVSGLGQGPFVVVVLELLSGLLLVFIFTELITTIRVVIARRKVVVEPFLIVGIVAAVRRLIVISAEAENLLGTAQVPGRDARNRHPGRDGAPVGSDRAPPSHQARRRRRADSRPGGVTSLPHNAALERPVPFGFSPPGSRLGCPNPTTGPP